MNHKIRISALLTAAVLLLGGCASEIKLDNPVPLESRTPTPVTATTASPATSAVVAAPTRAAQSQVTTVDLNKTVPVATTTASAPLARVVYFDFDSFVVKDEFRSVVEGHGKALTANKSRRMVVEGHTDERGGREYNLALGQKRAQAVLKSLTLVGATEAQLEAVSFGKERPAAAGDDEAAWAKNRRAELKDR